MIADWRHLHKVQSIHRSYIVVRRICILINIKTKWNQRQSAQANAYIMKDSFAALKGILKYAAVSQHSSTPSQIIRWAYAQQSALCTEWGEVIIYYSSTAKETKETRTSNRPEKKTVHQTTRQAKPKLNFNMRTTPQIDDVRSACSWSAREVQLFYKMQIACKTLFFFVG